MSQSRQRHMLSTLENSSDSFPSSRTRIQNQSQSSSILPPRTGGSRSARPPRPPTLPTSNRLRSGQNSSQTQSRGNGGNSRSQQHVKQKSTQSQTQGNQNGRGSRLQLKNVLEGDDDFDSDESLSDQNETQAAEVSRSRGRYSKNAAYSSKTKTTAAAAATKGQRGRPASKVQPSQKQNASSSYPGSRSMKNFIDDEASSEEESESSAGSASEGDKKKKSSKNQGTKHRAARGKIAPKSDFDLPGKGGICLSKENLVQNAVLYFLVKQNKPSSFTRTEIIRDALNGQRKVFDVVMKKVEKTLLDIFLLKLVGFDKSNVKGKDQFDSYILVSRVPHSVLYDPQERKEEDGEQERILNFLYVILTCIYMSGNPLDDTRIWDILTKLEFHTDLCPDRENLEKFLKSEFVSKHYLQYHEITKVSSVGNHEKTKATYEWGLRSLNEFSKMQILKTTAQQLGILDVSYFAQSYTEAKQQIEIYGSLNLPDNDASAVDVEGESNAEDDSASEIADLETPMASVSISQNSSKAVPGPGTTAGVGGSHTRKWTQEEINNSLVETQPMDVDSDYDNEVDSD